VGGLPKVAGAVLGVDAGIVSVELLVEVVVTLAGAVDVGGIVGLDFGPNEDGVLIGAPMVGIVSPLVGVPSGLVSVIGGVLGEKVSITLLLVVGAGGVVEATLEL
jgi:hypothetical protein